MFLMHILHSKNIKNEIYFFFKTFIKILILFFCSTLVYADNKIIVASTTSTYDTGLLDVINSKFYDKYSIRVQVLSLGTGQAIRTAEDGNAEILLVHHKPSELEFMSNGFGVDRSEIMYNDYILIGPKDDNTECISVQNKLKQIHDNKLLFISRGDDSGTHRKEAEMWLESNLRIYDKLDWYFSVGQGMGSTLLITNEKRGYSLSDRSTWIAFNYKDNLKIVCENLPPLFNQYGMILVNPNLNKNLNFNNAKKYFDWFKTSEVKELINNFEVKGKQLFFYNYSQ